MDERLEAVDLLEDCWFFENLFDRRRRMLRCNSDPCPSSKFTQEMLPRSSSGETPLSIKTLSEDDALVPPDLVRAPSLPTCMGKEEVDKKESNSGMTKPTKQSLLHNLLRTPSLPPCMGREEETQENESDFTMSKLIRQASLNATDALPPRRASKSMTRWSTIPRLRSRRIPEAGSMIVNGPNDMKHQYFNQTKIRKSPSDLEYEEVQGFKDLGFKFDKEDLNPSVVSILPGLQEKNRIGSDDDKVRRPYLSEAWIEQSSAPPMPNWVVKRSAEDMKAQIKFWARAVASNVRQEC